MRSREVGSRRRMHTIPPRLAAIEMNQAITAAMAAMNQA
jgi:hypothetical protein